MSIKFEAEKYFTNQQEERELAIRLDEIFDITFRNTIGELSYWLAMPKVIARERFGLQQEVLVIYSRHPKTDARVLTGIENITRSPDFKHRVEKVLFLLIHNGVQDETETLVKSSVDRIIVCIEANDLMRNDRGIFI